MECRERVCEADDQKTPLKTTSPPLSPAAVSPVLPMIARQWLFMHFWWHWDFEAVRRCPWRGSLGELANVWMRVGGWSARPRPSAAGVRATCSLESGALMATATVSGASRQNDVESRELRLQGREKGYIALPREGLRPSRDVRSHDGFTTCQLNTSHIMPFGQPEQRRAVWITARTLWPGGAGGTSNQSFTFSSCRLRAMGRRVCRVGRYT